MNRRMNVSGLLNIQSTTTFFPNKKAKGMKCRDEQDGKVAGNLGSLHSPSPPGMILTLPGLSGQAWSCAVNSCERLTPSAAGQMQGTIGLFCL